MFPALPGLDHRPAAYLLDEAEAHIGHGRAAVQPSLRLHLDDDVFQHLVLIFVQLQLLQDKGIALDGLVRRETDGKSGPLRMVLDQVNDGVQAAVDGPAVIVLAAKVLAGGTFLVMGDVKRVPHQLVDALVPRGGYRDDGDPQQGLHLVDVDGAAVPADLVHHVQRNHHGDVHFQELYRQVQVPLNVRRIHNVDDGAGFFVQNEVSGDDLLTAVGRHGIDARQVRDQSIGMSFDNAVLAVHRHARKIPNVLVCPRELVEQRGLAGVLVAHQRVGQQSPLRQGLAAPLRVIFALLTQTGVFGLGTTRSLPRLLLRLNRPDLNVPRVLQAKRQLVVMDAQLHGIPHGGETNDRQFHPGDDPHVQKMLAKGSLTPNGCNDRAFPDL